MVFYTIVYRLFGPPEFVVLGCISGQLLLGLGSDPVLTGMTCQQDCHGQILTISLMFLLELCTIYLVVIFIESGAKDLLQ